MTTEYRRHHYVPRWYQERFFPRGVRERKFFYLDLKPDRLEIPGKSISRSPLLRWGTKRCFRETDLYTTSFSSLPNVDIEKFFFGPIDDQGRRAVEHFAEFSHPNWSQEAFNAILPYMSAQKLRTPKGIGGIQMRSRATDKNAVLMFIQHVRDLYCATWTDCVWQIADAKHSPTRFILTDHPVTVYNRACFPYSRWCVGFSEPDIRQVGTHTLFPLSLDKILILTNLSWARNPYQLETRAGPNVDLFRSTLFSFESIQVERMLSEEEVLQINYIMKKRALRYVAAAEEQWLYPEASLTTTHWSKFGDGLLCMPDPRALYMGGERAITYTDGRVEHFGEWGHRANQPGFRDERRSRQEAEGLSRFQDEFAYHFGPRRRGRSHNFGRLDPEADDPEVHQWHVERHRARLREAKGHRSKRRLVRKGA